MHEYDQKNLQKWHKTLTTFAWNWNPSRVSSMIPLENPYGTLYQRDMLEHFPYIGGAEQTTSIMSCSASSVHLSTENIPVLRATIVISN